MSTRASLPHLSPGTAASGAVVQSAFAWKEELNARLREHRQRRGEPDAETVPAPAAARPSSGIAARVAQRYSSAPSYGDLLAASAAAASAAGSAAAAALEAHAAARAVLSEWDAQAELRSTSADPEPVGVAVSDDVFADPYFTEPARPRWEETAVPQTHHEAERGREATVANLPFEPIVAHHAPLPERTSLPERVPVAARARALVDAFAEAVVPAATQLPAKLIEFPRELIAAHRQRPRLAEGPLAESLLQAAHPAGALSIFEVDSPQAAAANDSISAEALSPTAPAMVDLDGTMSRRDEEEEFDQKIPRRRAAFDFEREQERVDGRAAARRGELTDDFDASAPPLHTPPPPSAAKRTPVTRTPMARASRNEDVAPLWKGRQPEAQTGWGSIRLGEHPQSQPEEAAPARPAARQSATAEPATAQATAFDAMATLADRTLAALMDFCLVFASFLLGLLVFASCTTHTPSGKGAVAAGAMALGVMGAFYGWLFMTYGGGNTPGMRYARIALCTFEDANPTRKELQNRVPATALALLPLGLGLIWALLDEDRLGWHDRMTRTYQRSYR